MPLGIFPPIWEIYVIFGNLSNRINFGSMWEGMNISALKSEAIQLIRKIRYEIFQISYHASTCNSC